MAKIRHDLLIKLGRIMRSVKPQRVEMGCIAQESNVCGTSACALGHAAMNKDFQNEGINLYKTEYGDIGVKVKSSRFQPSDFDSAGARIFGITIEEANDLFRPAYELNQKEEFLTRYRAFMKSKNLHM